MLALIFATRLFGVLFVLRLIVHDTAVIFQLRVEVPCPKVTHAITSEPHKHFTSKLSQSSSSAYQIQYAVVCLLSLYQRWIRCTNVAASHRKKIFCVLIYSYTLSNQTRIKCLRCALTTYSISLCFQSRYLVLINDFEWPSQPIPSAAHCGNSHVFQKVVNKLGPPVKMNHI